MAGAAEQTTPWALLADVPPDEARELLQVGRRRRFARNEVVFHRDDPGDSLHLIVSGRFAARVVSPLGDTVTLALHGPGGSFGEMVLLGEGVRRSATVVALEAAETIAIYRDDFERLRHRHPAVDRILVDFLAARVRGLNALLLEAFYLPVEKRLARRLAELAELYPEAPDGSVTITLTQETIAEIVGASRATVNQALRDEERRGILELVRGRTRIVDRDALARRARA